MSAVSIAPKDQKNVPSFKAVRRYQFRPPAAAKKALRAWVYFTDDVGEMPVLMFYGRGSQGGMQWIADFKNHPRRTLDRAPS